MIEYILLPALFELITIMCRNIFGPHNSRQDIFTGGIHIHHAYIGMAMVLLYLFYQNQFLLLIGYSLLISDLIHHFIILPILVGRTEFP